MKMVNEKEVGLTYIKLSVLFWIRFLGLKCCLKRTATFGLRAKSFYEDDNLSA